MMRNARSKDGLASVRKHTDQLYDQISQALEAYTDGGMSVDEMYFFGSRVRGTHRPDSDIDIFVRVDTGKRFDEENFSGAFVDWFRMEGWADAIDVGIPIDIFIAKRKPKQKELPVVPFYI